MPTVHRMRLTPRDHVVLGELADVTVLNTDIIHRRHFCDDVTGKSCLRRLRYFTASRLVIPVTVTACFGPRSARQTVYRLSATGADVIAQKTGRPVRWMRTDPKA